LDRGLTAGPEFLNHFTSEASALTLSESSHENREVKVVSGDKVAAEIAKLE